MDKGGSSAKAEKVMNNISSVSENKGRIKTIT